MRGRITKSVQQNYRLFVKVLCEKKVPLGVVITNLENQRCMEEWWTNNEKVFKNSGIYPDGHACITASPAVAVILPERYKESRERMRELLRNLTLSTGTGWRKEKKGWLIDLLGKMAKILLPRRGRSSQGPTRAKLTKKLVKECGFSSQDAKSIAASIIEVIRDQNPDSDASGSSL
ncbi:hypothetical protein J3R82DRAFT_10875 [Butyriboletus roseoflavus]|nr:hypothetical protein J3R82DRAFT_10875 [Butyriboletus roseoflavus]